LDHFPSSYVCPANGRKRSSIEKESSETFIGYDTGPSQTCYEKNTTFSTEEASRISGFLIPMLDLLPENRANAGGMSNHEFMKGTTGMDNVNLSIPVGSKGEGIEGWASEVKKR